MSSQTCSKGHSRPFPWSLPKNITVGLRSRPALGTSKSGANQTLSSRLNRDGSCPDFPLLPLLLTNRAASRLGHQPKSVTRKTILKISDLWNVIQVTLEAAGGRHYDLSHKRSRQCAFSASVLAKWLVNTCILSGSYPVTKQLKKWASEIRASVFESEDLAQRVSNPLTRCILDPTEDDILQLSFLGRSLPCGDKKVITESLENHRKSLETPFKTSSYLLGELSQFTKRFMRKHKVPRTFGTFNLTSGACLERSRKENGLGGFLLDVYNDPLPDWNRIREDNKFATAHDAFLSASAPDWTEDYDQEPFHGKLDGLTSQDLALDAGLRDKLIKRWIDSSEKITHESQLPPTWEYSNSEAVDEVSTLLYDFRYPELLSSIGGSVRPVSDIYDDRFNRDIDIRCIPICERHAIPERGFKSRVVTKSPGALVALAHHVRLHILSSLKLDPSLRSILLGEETEELEKTLSRSWITGEKLTVLSADLTSASDLLPLDAVAVMVSAISEELDLPEWERQIFRDCTGPMFVRTKRSQITDDVITDFDGFLTKRGILMGLPTTWVLLSLLQLFWADFAKREVLREQRDMVPYPHFICGDDLVAVWPRQVVYKYESVVRRFGGSMSQGKHLRSDSHGIFLEKIFKMKKSDGPVSVFSRTGDNLRNIERGHGLIFEKYTETIPLKAMAGDMRSSKTSDVTIPLWAKVGDFLNDLYSEFPSPGSHCKIARTFRVLHSDMIRWSRSKGFVPYLPVEFGGLGIPAARITTKLVEGKPSHRIHKDFRQFEMRHLCSKRKFRALGGFLYRNRYDADYSIYSKVFDPVKRSHGCLSKDFASQDLESSKETSLQVLKRGKIPYNGRFSCFEMKPKELFDMIELKSERRYRFMFGASDEVSKPYLFSPCSLTNKIKKIDREFLRKSSKTDGKCSLGKLISRYCRVCDLQVVWPKWTVASGGREDLFRSALLSEWMHRTTDSDKRRLLAVHGW